ncbi:hypothetical protein QL285_057823 [Trifolium repens]|nr:hypothetical protein QL285_057823 [Trifolium repens]
MAYKSLMPFSNCTYQFSCFLNSAVYYYSPQTLPLLNLFQAPPLFSTSYIFLFSICLDELHSIDEDITFYMQRFKFEFRTLHLFILRVKF